MRLRFHFHSRCCFHVLGTGKQQFAIATLLGLRKNIEPRPFIIGRQDIIGQQRIGNAGILHSSFKMIKLVPRDFNGVVSLGSRTHIIHVRLAYRYFVQGCVFLWVYPLRLGFNTDTHRSSVHERLQLELEGVEHWFIYAITIFKYLHIKSVILKRDGITQISKILNIYFLQNRSKSLSNALKF